MRVLLANPHYPISETPSPPLGLACLAAVLEKAGFEVKIIDFVVFPYSREFLEDLLKIYSPDFLGITSVTMTFPNAIKIARDAKAANPEIVTIMGGPHVTFHARETLKMFPELDIVAIGEGDKTLLDIVRTYQKNKSLSGISGVVSRSSTGPIIHKKRKKVDLDTLPMPARHLLPLGRYRALNMPISITTSRGCPFECIFCVGKKMGGTGVRFRKPLMVGDELEDIAALNFKQINIADDLFTASKKHCAAVCQEIIKRNLNIKWTAFARVDTVSIEILETMKEAGCCAVSFGVESANTDILNSIKKGITTAHVYRAVEMCNKAGITPHASFILGLPGETPETLNETLEFSARLKDMGLSSGFHLLAPFPGTEIRENINDYDLRILTNDWSQYHANRSVSETRTVSREMLDTIIIDWEEKYNAYLGDIKRRMKTGEADTEEAGQVINLERIVLIYDLMMSGALEKKGAIPFTKKHPDDPGELKILVQKISRYTKFSEKQIFETLCFAKEQGSLKSSKQDGHIKWEWVDYL